MTPATVILNNRYQKTGQAHLISYQEDRMYPNWVVICKINGVEKGKGIASKKNIATEIAAQAAVTALNETR